MNYIKKLEVVAASYTEQVMDARDCLENFRAYLQSSKFHEDTTVQVQDVLNRLECIIRLEPFGILQCADIEVVYW